jgi:tetratricopeptide (TPR) repeat protein
LTENNNKNEIVPTASQSLVRYSSSLFRRGLEDWLETIGEQAPIKNDGEAWAKKGYSLARELRYEEALECYEKALAIDERNTLAWISKGIALFDMGRFTEAMESYERAVAIDPSEPESWPLKGVCHFELRQFEQAVFCYDKFLGMECPSEPPERLRHSQGETWARKGRSLGKMGLDAESLECYKKATAISPEFPLVWFLQGRTLEDMKAFEEAIASYDKAIELDPGHFESWQHKVSSLTQTGQLEVALACLEKSGVWDNGSAGFWHVRGAIQEVLGSTNDAIESYEHFLAVAGSADTDIDTVKEHLQILKSGQT